MTMHTIRQYTEYLMACGHPAGTVEQYTGTAARLLTHCATDDPATVTERQVVGWLAAHSAWAPNTRRKQVQNARGYFAWCIRVGLVEHDPTAVLKPVRGAASTPRPCPDDTYTAALASTAGDDYWRLRLAGDTGARRAELAAAHTDDVTRGVLGWMLFIDGKGRRQRHVPLPDDLAAWVRGQEGYVWPSPFGGHMIPSAVGKRYRAMLGGRWTTHTLRHRYATRAYAAHHDLEAVRRLLGHESVRTTQQYIATADEQVRQAAESAWVWDGHGTGITAA